MQRFPIAEEAPQLFLTWLEMVSTQKISGKRIHDVRIAAMMKIASIDYILTLNPGDFSNISDITVVHPRQIIDAE